MSCHYRDGQHSESKTGIWDREWLNHHSTTTILVRPNTTSLQHSTPPRNEKSPRQKTTRKAHKHKTRQKEPHPSTKKAQQDKRRREKPTNTKQDERTPPPD